jgi:hypothetical protein
VIDLPTVANAPREVSIRGVTYRGRALNYNHLAEVYAWLEERVETDGEPFRFSSDACRLALATSEGLGLVLHLSLSSCHPDLSRDAARALASDPDPALAARILAVAFRRRRVRPSSDPGKDLAEIDWGPAWDALAGHKGALYEAAGNLTPDQLDVFLGRGETDDEGTLTPAEVQAMWEASPAILRPGESIVMPSPEAPTDGS